MKKYIFIMAILTFSINTVLAQQTVNLAYALKETAEYMNERLPAGSKVVVLNFTSDDQVLSEYVIDELINHIVNSHVLVAVERQSLELIRNEMNIQLSGDVSDESAQAIGRQLGAQSIISGAIQPYGSEYILRARAIAVETAIIQGMISRIISDDASIRRLTGRRGGGSSRTSSLSTSNIMLSIGGGATLTYRMHTAQMGSYWTTNYPNLPGSTNDKELGIGAFVFFDATYAEINLGYYIGQYRNNSYWINVMQGQGGPRTYEGSMTYLNFGILGKYPFYTGGFLLYPLLGVQYNKILSYEHELGQPPGNTEYKDNTLWILAGGGADYFFSNALFIRGQFLWGYGLRNEYQKSSDSQNAHFTHGPLLKIGVGYRFR